MSENNMATPANIVALIRSEKDKLLREQRYESAHALRDIERLLIENLGNQPATLNDIEAILDDVREAKNAAARAEEGVGLMEQRLERLGNSVDELFGYRNSFIANHQEAGSRIEKMEKALSEEMAKTRELDDILAGVVRDVERLKHYSPVKWSDMKVRDDGSVVPPVTNDFHFVLDAGASPKDIPFSVALEFLKAGRTILAPGGTRYIMQDGQVRQTDGTIHTRAFVGGELLLSSQWTVLPEKPQNP